MIVSCSVMGREVTGIQVVDKRPNCIIVPSNGGSHEKVIVSPRIAGVKAEAKDNEVMKSPGVSAFVEKFNEKKDVLSAKSTNHYADLPEEKNEKSEAQKMGDNKKLSSPAARSTPVRLEHTQSMPQPSDLATEKNGSYTQTVGIEAIATGLNMSPNANNVHSPNFTKHSQVIEMFIGLT